MWIRRKMDEYLLFDKYSFNNLRDESLSAKWRNPKGKPFDKGQWCELPWRCRNSSTYSEY
jgi:hypothetical protein